MEEEEVSSLTLPNDIIEQMVAVVPFPFIFTARALSKSWLARFSSISSLDDEVEQRSAISFQKQVVQSSVKWKTFCTVFFIKSELIAYDGASQHWHRMPSLSFLPENLLTNLQPENFRSRRSNLQMEGALVLVCNEAKKGKNISPLHEVSALDFYVGNIFTQSWKELPPRPPFPHRTHTFRNLVLIPTSLETYKLVFFLTGSVLDSPSYVCGAQIYDSGLGLWNNIGSEALVQGSYWNSGSAYVSDFPLLSNWVRFNRVLYSVVNSDPRNHWGSLGLMAFNTEEESFELFPMPTADLQNILADLVNIVFSCGAAQLVVCNGNLLMIVIDVTRLEFPNDWLIVLKIDLESRRWLEVTRGPPISMDFPMRDVHHGFFKRKAASDGHCIYLSEARHPSKKILAYNMDIDGWSLVPIPAVVCESYAGTVGEWKPLSCEPGLNTFVAV